MHGSQTPLYEGKLLVYFSDEAYGRVRIGSDINLFLFVQLVLVRLLTMVVLLHFTMVLELRVKRGILLFWIPQRDILISKVIILTIRLTTCQMLTMYHKRLEVITPPWITPFHRSIRLHPLVDTIVRMNNIFFEELHSIIYAVLNKNLFKNSEFIL